MCILPLQRCIVLSPPSVSTWPMCCYSKANACKPQWLQTSLCSIFQSLPPPTWPPLVQVKGMLTDASHRAYLACLPRLFLHPKKIPLAWCMRGHFSEEPIPEDGVSEGHIMQRSAPQKGFVAGKMDPAACIVHAGSIHTFIKPGGIEAAHTCSRVRAHASLPHAQHISGLGLLCPAVSTGTGRKKGPKHIPLP